MSSPIHLNFLLLGHTSKHEKLIGYYVTSLFFLSSFRFWKLLDRNCFHFVQIKPKHSLKFLKLFFDVSIAIASLRPSTTTDVSENNWRKWFKIRYLQLKFRIFHGRFIRITRIYGKMFSWFCVIFVQRPAE